MGFFKEILLNFNSFQTQQFFRFNGDHEYTNVTGGIFTILIRGLLLALLVVKLISVFSYSSVNATTTTKYQINQVNGTVLSPSNATSPFLIAIEAIQTSGRLDRATLIKDTVAWTWNSSYVYTYLEPCTPDHWSAVPADVYQQILDSITPESLLFCLPKNYSHNLTIAQDKSIEIDFAYRCRENCDTIPYTKFLVRPIIYNRLINNQQSQQYITTFLQKRNYYGIGTFNYDVDILLNFELSKYSIKTDKSILPYESVSQEEGLFIPQQPNLAYLPNRYPTFIFFRMNFALSNQEYHHFRSFTKIFDAISLVGGLIPVFMLLFVWLNYYAMAQFEMAFVKRMHSDQRAKDYGVFYFVSKIFYSVLRFMNIDMDNWKETQQFHDMHRKVAHLIDVLYLYKRLEFLERALQMILEDHQLKVLHLMSHKTFQQAESDYQRYQMKINLQKFIEKRRQKIGRSDLKSSGNSRRQIFLDPYPVETENKLGEPQNSHKNLMVSKQLDADNPPNEFKTRNENTNEANIINEQDSECNSEVQRVQMDALREAYRCYERLRREAQDKSTFHFSWISKNIFNRIEKRDKEDFQNLNYLLKAQDRAEVMNIVMKDLMEREREQTSIEQSLLRKKSTLSWDRNRLEYSSREFRSLNNGTWPKLEKLPEKKDDDEDDL